MRLIVQALCCALCFTAPASAKQILFHGALRYISADHCADQRAGNAYHSTYRPSNIGDNGNATFINEVFDFGAHGYQLDEGRFTSSFRTVNAFDASYQGNTYQARIRIIKSDPPDAQITATTDHIWLIGQTEGPQGDPGVGGFKCVITWRAAYVRQNHD